MAWIAWTLVAVVALLHILFMAAEMFAWEKMARRVVEPSVARATKALGANQGLYNGFLAAGLIWSLRAPPAIDTHLAVFFLGFVVVAGIFGALTILPINYRLFVLQSVPALCALLALWMVG
jgi:putative membrane protein